MVESSPVVLKALRATVQKLGATRIELAGLDAMNFIDSDRRRFDVIFLDPPYRLDLLPRLLPKLHAHLADGGLVYLEDDCPAEFEGWAVWRRGHAGKVCYHLLSSTIN
jgi:16S rRNA G966 N2-methylase RsmD